MNILTGPQKEFHFEVILIYLFLVNLLNKTFNEKTRELCVSMVLI